MARSTSGDTAHRRGRTAAATALAVILGVATALALLATYARDTLLSTDAYVEQVAPLSEDPAVQRGVADAATDALARSLDAEALAGRDLPDRLAGTADALVERARAWVAEAATAFTAGDRFGPLWEQVNRRSHETLMAVATGEQGAMVTADESDVVLDLGVVLDQVRERLVQDGFAAAARAPDVDMTFVLVEGRDVQALRTTVERIDQVADVAPWVALAAAVMIVAVAPVRRGVTAVGVAVALGAGLAWIAARIAGAVATGELASWLGADTADAYVSVLVSPLDRPVVAVAAGGIVVVLLARVIGVRAPDRRRVGVTR